ncbi:MAG TPA: FkbM family methyltransferase [Burkholderiaceae bacterium]|nr:FkbM family methyltransferase [Burkholderiaceae bacterium]
MNSIDLIKQALRKAGWQVSRLTTTSSFALQTAKVVESNHIDVVLDIGANTGQFGNELRAFGYKGKLVSFEPLPDAHQALLDLTKHDEHWHVHPRCAVGSNTGCIQINVAGNSVSSSILPMLDKHLNSAPQSKYTHTIDADMITLDSVYTQYCCNDDTVLIKIDTQGYEWQVLDGASAALKACKGLMIELSLVPLYENQRLWFDIHERLKTLNFELYSLQPVFIDDETGRTLQIDGIFIKQQND